MDTDKITQIDIRKIPPSERHPGIVFEKWNRLNVGETLQIINDHDPGPLRYQFEIGYKDSFIWEYVTKGPKDWIINIKKIKAT
ncbi:MAG: DUF2249 domain-containing protein [Nitrospinae bacterium]|nr:DUF2249 domain-containing protein [Nitrospinota bacterium]